MIHDSSFVKRELRMPGRPRWLIILGNGLVRTQMGRWRTVWGLGGEHARGDFDRLLRKQLDEGWTETEKSLSWRIFTRADYFWTIELDATSLTVQYGMIPAPDNDWNEKTGHTRTRKFTTRDEALAQYRASIARKLEKGYVEVQKRRTPYSK
jgi:predicted DNA-binding WGR domain protein